MRHYVLTRSAYGPAWSLDANRRRLSVTRAVTARLMAEQTDRDWTWIVLLDSRDALLDERLALYSKTAPAFVPMLWTPPSDPQPARWDRHGDETNNVQRIAAEAYRAPWRESMDDGPAMMVRLDDDDGLAPDAIARYRAAAAFVRERTILMLPTGIRVWRGRYSAVRHERNAMHALVVPAGDPKCVYDYGHAKCHKAAPIVMVDQSWGWIWVRHQDTISGWKRAERRLTPQVVAAFPIDWKAMRRAWA